MTLCQMKPGQCAAIERVECETAIRARLSEMGVTPGITVKLIRFAPFGGPVLISLRGYMLALRKNQAARIYVRNEELQSAPAQLGNRIAPQRHCRTFKGDAPK